MSGILYMHTGPQTDSSYCNYGERVTHKINELKITVNAKLYSTAQTGHLRGRMLILYATVTKDIHRQWCIQMYTLSVKKVLRSLLAVHSVYDIPSQRNCKTFAF